MRKLPEFQKVLMISFIKFQLIFVLRESNFFEFMMNFPFDDCSQVFALVVEGKIIWGKLKMHEKFRISL
jgi:hypothetical protein